MYEAMGIGLIAAIILIGIALVITQARDFIRSIFGKNKESKKGREINRMKQEDVESLDSRDLEKEWVKTQEEVIVSMNNMRTSWINGKEKK